jgi:hypothetical protein
MSDKSVAELRKMLREHRKTAQRPVGKMAKHEVLMELEKHGLHHAPAPAPAPTPSVAKVEIPVKEEVKKVKKVKGETAVEKKEVLRPSVDRKFKEPKAEVGEVPKTGRGGLIKGSAEAKEYMNRIRMARKTKKESV